MPAVGPMSKSLTSTTDFSDKSFDRIKRLIGKKTDPYEGLRFEQGKARVKKYLTQEELNMLMKVKISNRSLCGVRGMFNTPNIHIYITKHTYIYNQTYIYIYD